MRSMLLGLFLAAGLALAGGNPAPDFQLRDVNNVQHSLSEWKGKVVLVNFWATWCQPCMVEMPHLEAMQKELGPKGFQVVGISADAARDASKVKPLITQKGLSYPILLDPQTTVVSMFNPAKTMPFNVIIDRTGAIASQHSGYNPGDEVKLKEEVLKLLGTP